MDDIPRRALEHLLEIKRLNRKALPKAEKEASEKGLPLEQVLIEQGEIDRLAYLTAASEVAGVPAFNLKAQKVSYSRAQSISKAMAEQFNVLPVGVEDGRLVLVMADPSDTFAMDRVASMTQMECSPRVTLNADLPEAIEQAFSVKVERITAETPHHQARPAEARSGMKFATATRQPVTLEQTLRKSLVQNLGTSRSVKIEGFVTAAPAMGDDKVDTPAEKLEFLEQNLIRLTGPADFKTRIRRILEVAQSVCRAEGASLLLLTEDRTELYFFDAVGQGVEELLKIRLPVDEHSVAGYAVIQRNTLRVNDAATDPRQSKETDAKTGYRTRSLIAAPVSWDGEPLGVLEVVNKRDGGFDDQDVEFMQILAVQASVATLVSRMGENLRNTRREAVEALRTVLDLCGVQGRAHGELVSRVAVALGKELKLSAQELERLELAGYVHDLGKSGGGKGHADRGSRILEKVGPLADLAPVVRHHHERFDGEGGPDGLAGDRIPRMARVLSFAEAWIEGLETLGLSRRSDVLREILAACGTRYDPAMKIPFEIAVNQVTPAG